MTRILGIESSCDETAAAVVEDGAWVRSNVVWSQYELHERYRGVVPEIASRAHLERILPVVETALEQAGVTLDEVDAVAVGNQPGLIGSLLVGVSAAQALAWATHKPLIGVDHVQAHLWAPFLKQVDANRGTITHDGGAPLEESPAAGPPTAGPPAYPLVGLVVSGGHTSLYRVDAPAALTPLGRTIDDAVGEAYDKAAVILGLPYPGGPHLDQLASNPPRQTQPQRQPAPSPSISTSPPASPSPSPSTPPSTSTSATPPATTASSPFPTDVKLPRSLLDKESLDFSYSGLKTALLYAVRGHPRGRGRDAAFPRSADQMTDADRTRLAVAFQEAAIDPLIIKLQRAVDQLTAAGTPPRGIAIGGGVSANSHLRRRLAALEREKGLCVHLPAMAYCLDNAAMIAGLAHAHYQANRISDLDLAAVATTEV